MSTFHLEVNFFKFFFFDRPWTFTKLWAKPPNHPPAFLAVCAGTRRCAPIAVGRRAGCPTIGLHARVAGEGDGGPDGGCHGVGAEAGAGNLTSVQGVHSLEIEDAHHRGDTVLWVGNSIFRSSIFWSFRSLKNNDRDRIALVDLWKRLTVIESISLIFEKYQQWLNRSCRSLDHKKRLIRSRKKTYVCMFLTVFPLYMSKDQNAPVDLRSSIFFKDRWDRFVLVDLWKEPWDYFDLFQDQIDLSIT